MGDNKKTTEEATEDGLKSADELATTGVPPGDDDQTGPPDEDARSVESDVGDGEPSPETERFSHIETEPDPEVASAPVSAEAVVDRRGGFGAAFAGGLVAAILGFLAAKADLIDPLLPPGWRSADMSAAISGLDARIAANSAQVTDIADRMDAISVPDIAPLAARMDDLGARIAPVSEEVAQMRGTLDAIDMRLTELEKRPLVEGVSPSAIAAYERELDALRDAVAQQRTEVVALIDEARALDSSAAEAARQAAIQTILTRLLSALDEGVPFTSIVDELDALGQDVPAQLANVSGDGVVTLSSLQSTYPAAARQALKDARAADRDGDKGLGAFLQRQLGARSVEPRDGDDPDAILSRAEAAVTNGQLRTALDELSALPDAAKPAMEDWMARADQRLAALEAAAALVQSATPK